MFSGKTILERIDSKTYQLNSTLSYENDSVKVTIKPGLKTDGASIPKLFWSIIGCPLMGKYVGSALIHDGLYGSHKLTQKQSDQLFLEMMEHNRVKWFRRGLMYMAVRIGGRFAYNSKSEEEVAEMSKFVTVKEK